MRTPVRVAAAAAVAAAAVASAATPVSVVVHGDLAYVLNALNGGSVKGYRVFGPAAPR